MKKYSKIIKDILNSSLFSILIGGILLGMATGYTFNPSWNALTAVLTLDKSFLHDENFEDSTERYRFRRTIQRHFLKHSLYLNLDDIILSENDQSTAQKLTFLMRKACGQAKMYVWVPMKIRLPVIGSKVWEWCWTSN